MQPILTESLVPILRATTAEIAANAVQYQCHGKQPHPCLQRRVSLDGLEELAQEEEYAEQGKVHQYQGQVCSGKGHVPEEVQGQHGVFYPHFPPDEDYQQDQAGGKRQQYMHLCPGPLSGFDYSVDQRE